MITKLSTKTKILIPMFFLTAILLFIASLIIYTNYTKHLSLQELNKKILLSSKVSAALHTIQKERGLSCAFTVSRDLKFKEQLLKQRETTDAMLERLKQSFNTVNKDEWHPKKKKLLKKISYLDNTRREIDLNHITYDGIIKYYSNINATLLDILVNISKESHVPVITEDILAYMHFLYLKEYMGIERAEGVTIFSKKNLSRESLLRFSNVLSLEKRSETMFLKYASKRLEFYYNEHLNKNTFNNIKKMRNIILYDKIQNANIQPQLWFQTMTKMLNTLDQVASFIEQDTLTNIEQEIKRLNNIFLLVTSLIIFSMIIFFIMIIAFFKLAREEQRLRLVMDKYVISSTTNLKGKIIDVSEAFCAISGYSKQDLIGQPHNIVRHPDTDSKLFEEMWGKLKQGLAWSGKIKNIRKDGTYYWVYANVEPLFNAAGIIDSYISIRLDITESELLMLKVKEEEKKNKFQEEMIREQSRLAQMGEMISMIAHQWRQPLSAIAAAAGSLQLKAKRNKLDTETTLLIADKIKNFSLHLSSTIDDFRNFFKSNKKESETNFETILTSVLSIIEGSLEKNRIELNLNIISANTLFTYENELKQVILNLIKNAEDALVENEIVKPYIDIQIEDNCFTIEDNAGGIPVDIIEKIFDPYFSTKTKKDGTGLGLYMSKIIVEDHCKGSISVTNEQDGAKFTIKLGEIDG